MSNWMTRDMRISLASMGRMRRMSLANVHGTWWLFPAGRMLLNDSRKGPAQGQYRRPHGCAALALSEVLHTISELKEEKEFVLKVYT